MAYGEKMVVRLACWTRSVESVALVAGAPKGMAGIVSSNLATRGAKAGREALAVSVAAAPRASAAMQGDTRMKGACGKRSSAEAQVSASRRPQAAGFSFIRGAL